MKLNTITGGLVHVRWEYGEVESKRYPEVMVPRTLCIAEWNREQVAAGEAIKYHLDVHDKELARKASFGKLVKELYPDKREHNEMRAVAWQAYRDRIPPKTGKLVFVGDSHVGVEVPA